MFRGWSHGGSFQEEESWIQRAVEVWGGLVAAYPGERLYRRHLAMGLCNLGNPVGYSGRRNEAEALCRRAITVMEGMPIDVPPTALERIVLASSYCNLATYFEQAGQLSEAIEALQKAIDAQLPLAGKNPDVPDYGLGMNAWEWMNFGDYYSQLGILLRRTRKYQEARPFIERSIRIQERLVASFPKSGAYAQHLHGRYGSLGELEQADGHPEAALRAYKEALRVAEQLSVEQPALGLRVLSEFLLHCTDARIRDPQRASALAEKDVAAHPEHADSWRTLALAKYRTGKHEQALEAAERAKRYGGPKYCRVGFIQAMSHWQLGDKEKARQCFRETTELLRDSHRSGEDLEKDEAVALLGIQDAPLPPEKGGPPSKK
jgi:tetratricopeptide (TPR) repeat protein